MFIKCPIWTDETWQTHLEAMVNSPLSIPHPSPPFIFLLTSSGGLGRYLHRAHQWQEFLLLLGQQYPQWAQIQAYVYLLLSPSWFRHQNLIHGRVHPLCSLNNEFQDHDESQ